MCPFGKTKYDVLFLNVCFLSLVQRVGGGRGASRCVMIDRCRDLMSCRHSLSRCSYSTQHNTTRQHKTPVSKTYSLRGLIDRAASRTLKPSFHSLHCGGRLAAAVIDPVGCLPPLTSERTFSIGSYNARAGSKGQ